MKIRLQVEIIGDNSVAWCEHSGTLEGEDAEVVQEMLNNVPQLEMFTFPKLNGDTVVLGRALLERTVITVKEIE